MYNTGSMLAKAPAGYDQREKEREEEQFSQKVLDLNMEELVQATRALNSSQSLHYVLQLSQILDSQYRLNPFEQKMIDDLIGKYSAQYKSPLAEALKE